MKNTNTVIIILDAATVLEVPAPEIKAAQSELDERLAQLSLTKKCREELMNSLDTVYYAIANKALSTGFNLGYTAGETGVYFELQFRA